MNKYFDEFVREHGGGSVFSEKVKVTRQSINNIIRGRNKATEKLIKEIEANFSDFDRTVFLDENGAKVYIDEIHSLKQEIAELKMKNKLLEESQKMWIGAIVQGSGLGKHEVYTSNQSGMNAMPYNISEFDKLDEEASVAFVAQTLYSDLIGEA